MSFEKAVDYFNKPTKQFVPRPDSGVRVRYLKVLENNSALVTVLSDDFVPTTKDGTDLAGNPVKYPGMQVFVRDETDGKEKVWNVPRAVGKKLVDAMTELKVQSPRDFTLKVKHVDQYTYETEVLKTPNGAAKVAVAPVVTDELLTKAVDVLRQFNGTMAQKDGMGIVLKVRLGLTSPQVGEQVVERLLEQKKISFESNRLRVA